MQEGKTLEDVLQELEDLRDEVSYLRERVADLVGSRQRDEDVQQGFEQANALIKETASKQDVIRLETRLDLVDEALEKILKLVQKIETQFHGGRRKQIDDPADDPADDPYYEEPDPDHPYYRTPDPDQVKIAYKSE